ncbi:SDR family oxidoreductase [Streptomyces johnsoniae]|uniref:NAD(P)H-binding protein n=1 Tax=Streptomyces johnsoniae TaxID=3075532 RepID=A0ABU2SEJ6_9ACTN|nr:NAD(P)H-binding protein [Streptomyces sp. DSM 41886]MDT0447387.1 NAD(P)H-binding protein [Streptomyces sp. DSM 41886]
MTILVTGATGHVGRLVTARLRDAGADVRALTRDPAAAAAVLPAGVGTAVGDLADPDSLRPALRGVERMYLFPFPGTAREVAALAARSGVRHVVVLSSGAVTAGFDTDFHLPVERAVAESGMAWTFVRPGEFMLNKLWLWGPSIRSARVVHEPFPEVPWYPVHEADIADVAAEALLTDRHTGAAHTLNGPELLTREEQVAAIAAALGEDIELVRVTPAEARERYLAQGGFAADNADFLLGFTDYSGQAADPAEGPAEGPAADPAEAQEPAPAAKVPTAADATGRPARTFADWARDHAADFT